MLRGPTVPAGPGTQKLDARGQALGQLPLEAGQVPSAPPTARVVIHTCTVKPHTALYDPGGDGHTRMGAAETAGRQRGAQVPHWVRLPESGTPGRLG